MRHTLTATVLALTIALPASWMEQAEAGLTHTLVAQLVASRTGTPAEPTIDPVARVHSDDWRIAITDNGQTVLPLHVLDLVCVDAGRSPDECTEDRSTVIDHATADTDDWQPLVVHHFGEDRLETAMRIMDCESGGNPDAANPYSSADGLYQFLNSTWERTPYAGWSKFDPEANIAAAAWLQNTGGWAQWSCY